MIDIKLSLEQAQLTANVLNQHKQQSQKTADVAGETIDLIMEASKQGVNIDGKEKADNQERSAS